MSAETAEPEYYHPAELIRSPSHTFQQWLQGFADLYEQVYRASYALDLHDLPLLFVPAYEKGQSVADFLNEQFEPDDYREPNDY